MKKKNKIKVGHAPSKLLVLYTCKAEQLKHDKQRQARKMKSPCKSV